MFILVLILTFLLPEAVLPLALETTFSPGEMLEMGVYLEDFQSDAAPCGEQLNSSQGGSLRSCAGLSA